MVISFLGVLSWEMPGIFFLHKVLEDTSLINLCTKTYICHAGIWGWVFSQKALTSSNYVSVRNMLVCSRSNLSVIWLAISYKYGPFYIPPLCESGSWKCSTERFFCSTLHWWHRSPISGWRIKWFLRIEDISHPLVLWHLGWKA